MPGVSLLNEETKQWTWNDGWILMSTYLAQSNKKSTLADVIAAADATNHAIPTPNELSQAFTKFVNAGILNIENNNYRIKSEFLDGIGKAYKSKGGLFKSAEKGQKWLNTKLIMLTKSTHRKSNKANKRIQSDKPLATRAVCR
jgi:hypothetical protein